MNGATDLDACKTRRTYGRGQSLCRCSPKCAVCGYGPHVALHGPALGQLPGSKPWDHEYTMPNDVPSEALLTAEEMYDILHAPTSPTALARALEPEQLGRLVLRAAAKAYAVGLRNGEAKAEREARALVEAWLKARP